MDSRFWIPYRLSTFPTFTSKRPISLAGQWDRLLVMRSISKPEVSGWGITENLVA